MSNEWLRIMLRPLFIAAAIGAVCLIPVYVLICIEQHRMYRLMDEQDRLLLEAIRRAASGK